MRVRQRSFVIPFCALPFALLLGTPLLAQAPQPSVRVTIVVESPQVVQSHLQREAGMVLDGGNQEGEWFTDSQRPNWGQFKGDTVHEGTDVRAIYFGIRKAPNVLEYVRRYRVSCTRTPSSGGSVGRCSIADNEMIHNRPYSAPDPMVRVEATYVPTGIVTRLELVFHIIGKTN